MRNTQKLVAGISMLTGAALCAVPSMFIATANAAEPAGDVLAVVNGTPIRSQDLAGYARARGGQGQPPPSRDEVLNEVITLELLYQDAVAKGLEKNPAVQADLEKQRHNVLASAAMSEAMRSKNPSEAEMRKFYDENVASKKVSEYKASHILVKTEDEAKAVIAELGKGGDFAKLAAQKSIDKASPSGDLGWFTANQMVEPFSKAVAAMQKGQTSKTPVQTQFGWHVIKLEDTRPVQPPKYDDVKEQIRGVIQQQSLRDHIAGLRQKAKVEIKAAAAPSK